MYNEAKEIREAIQAGERALNSLYEAQTKLKKARDRAVPQVESALNKLKSVQK